MLTFFLVLFGVLFLFFLFSLVFQANRAQHGTAQSVFAQALATKQVVVNPSDVTTDLRENGETICSVVQDDRLIAHGEYRDGTVLVNLYPLRGSEVSCRPFMHISTNP